jgi:hypothetical protein
LEPFIKNTAGTALFGVIGASLARTKLAASSSRGNTDAAVGGGAAASTSLIEEGDHHPLGSGNEEEDMMENSDGSGSVNSLHLQQQGQKSVHQWQQQQQ